MSKVKLVAGYKWCEKCQAAVPGEICTEHQLDRPATLSRYEAKILYDIALSLGYEEAYAVLEQAQVIRELIADLENGTLVISPVTLGPKGFAAG